MTARPAPDGLPESIRAATDWQRRQGPEAIGGAVVDAYGVAMSEQMSGWVLALERSDWQAKADRLDGPIGQLGPSSVPATDNSVSPGGKWPSATV